MHCPEWDNPELQADIGRDHLRVYISGPMSGIPEFNFPAFKAAAAKLRAAGHWVISPVELDEDEGFDSSQDAPDVEQYGHFLARDIEAMSTADLDAIVLLPGWENSKGVGVELAYARAIGLEVYLYGEDGLGPEIEKCPCGCEQSMAAPGYAEAHGDTPSAPQGTKPTNPKDAIGSDKLPMHLWPTTATIQGALALLDGALKYGRSNWRAAGVRYSIYYDAARRHLDAAFEGEDADPDSGLPHEAHALACLAIIVDARAAGKLLDDRAFNGGAYRETVTEATEHVRRLKEKHADRDPHHYTIEDEAA